MKEGNHSAVKIVKKRYAKKYDLTAHFEKVHEGKSQSYKCSIYNKNFSLKSSLNRHVLQIHKEEKPHKCRNFWEKFWIEI